MKAARSTRELALTVCQVLGARNQTMGSAESCTGGLIAAAITSVPGSSVVFLGAIVAYANPIKHGLLGVPADLFDRHGAVSRQCVQAMARGARQRVGVDWSIAVSGIAGPGGATPGKPVGTVWIAVEGPRTAASRHFVFGGSRARVRAQAVQAALSMLLAGLNNRVARTRGPSR